MFKWSAATKFFVGEFKGNSAMVKFILSNPKFKIEIYDNVDSIGRVIKRQTSWFF